MVVKETAFCSLEPLDSLRDVHSGILVVAHLGNQVGEGITVEHKGEIMVVSGI